MLRLPAIILFSVLFLGLVAQEKKDDLRFNDRFEKLEEANIFRSKAYYNWCSSIIKGEDGKYHLFYSRWPREYTFYAWLTHSEVAHAVSDSPTGPWTYKETVLASRGKGNWDAITVHNPKIKYFDGKYYIYYCSTHMGDKAYTEQDLIETAKTGYSHPNWKILRPNQRTGVAVANSLNGPWKRLDHPIIEPSGPISTLTVNPAIARGKDGKYHLIVKGDKPGSTKFERNQVVAIADSPSGPFEMQNKPVIDYMDTEDVSMWYDESRDYFYGVFHAHTFIGMVASPDGLNWDKANQFELMKKQIPVEDGDPIKPDRMERPFIFCENGAPRVLSLAVKKGDDAYIVFVPIKDKQD